MQFDSPGNFVDWSWKKREVFWTMSYCILATQEAGSTRFLFYKKPISRPSSKRSLFLDILLSNSSAKSSLIVT